LCHFLLRAKASKLIPESRILIPDSLLGIRDTGYGEAAAVRR